MLDPVRGSCYNKTSPYKTPGFYKGLLKQSLDTITQRKGHLLNKQELIDSIAESADISKASAARALDGMVGSITDALKAGDSLTLVGFGTFSVRKREARAGRNPKTGEAIQIKAANVPAFKAGKALKDAVN